MARRSKVNDFHTFVGTSLFGLFALVLASGRSSGFDPSDMWVTLGMSALLLVASFYVLEAGRRAGSITRPARRAVVAVPLALLRSKLSSRAA